MAPHRGLEWNKGGSKSRTSKDDSLIRSHNLRTPRVHHINDIRRTGTEHRIDLPHPDRRCTTDSISILTAQFQPTKQTTLTPKPFKNKKTKFNPNPTFTSSTYVVTKPDPMIDTGTMNNAPTSVPRIRSSGYHMPPRFARYRMTILSEIRPARGAATAIQRRSEWWKGSRVSIGKTEGRTEGGKDGTNRGYRPRPGGSTPQSLLRL